MKAKKRYFQPTWGGNGHNVREYKLNKWSGIDALTEYG